MTLFNVLRNKIDERLLSARFGSLRAVGSWHPSESIVTWWGNQEPTILDGNEVLVVVTAKGRPKSIAPLAAIHGERFTNGGNHAYGDLPDGSHLCLPVHDKPARTAS